MQTLEFVLSNYIYIKDEDAYVTPNGGRGKQSSFDRLAQRLAKRFPERSMQDIHNKLKSLEATGMLRAEFDKIRVTEQSETALSPARVYEAIKPYLPFRYLPMIRGQIIAFYLDQNNQLIKVTPPDAEGLANSLRSLHDIYDSFHEAFYASDTFLEIRTKYTINQALTIAIEHLLMDPDYRLKEEPPLLSWDASKPAFRVLSPEVLVDAPTPTWDEFTTRLDFPDIFMAWVWSIFMPENFGRQIMWLTGSGYDGKSNVCDAIANFLGGNEFVATLDTKNTQFTLSKLHGKRLVLYNDCRNIRLHKMDDIKRLTGKDKTSVEFKNENSFTALVYAKLLVNSNWYPRIDFSQKSEYSRVLALQVAPSAVKGGDVTFQPRLEAEMGAFLYKCRLKHNELYGAKVDLEPIPEALLEKMQRLCESEESQAASAFIANRCEFGQDAEYLDVDLQRDLKEFIIEMHLEKHVRNAVRDSLEQRLMKFARVEMTERNGQKHIKVWRGVGRRKLSI